MNIKINLKENSSFNSEEHFIDCLKDLIIEWEDMLGVKEMDEEEVGFDYERLTELKEALKWQFMKS